jgi:hypothetical protein
MIHIVRLLGVAWVAVLCFWISFIVSRILDNFTPKLDESKSRVRLVLEVTLQFAIIGMIAFMSRGLIKKVPFPFDGASGYIHSQLNEVRTVPLFVFIFMFFQGRTQEKMRYLST